MGPLWRDRLTSESDFVSRIALVRLMLFMEKIVFAGLSTFEQDARQNVSGRAVGKDMSKSENHFHFCSSIPGLPRATVPALRSPLVHACRTFAFAVVG